MSGTPESQADTPLSHKGNAPVPAAAQAPSQAPPQAHPADASGLASTAVSGENQPIPASHAGQGGKFPSHFQGKPNRQAPGPVQGQPPHHHQTHNHHQGQPQGQRGYNNNNSGNKNYYNKRGYNNPKIPGAQGQFSYPANYQYYYQPMFYNQGMMGGVPGYSPQSPQLSQSPVQTYPQAAQVPVQGSPAGISKVKITDKDGKQVNLEDKKKSSASSSASTTPVPSQAQIATGSASPAKSQTPESEDQAAAAAAAAAKKKEAADEFRRKILEKAKAAKEKKEAEKRAAEGAKEAAKEAPKQETPAVPEPKVEAEPVSKPVEPASEKAETPAETVEKAPAAPVTPAAPAAPVETPVESPAPVETPAETPAEAPAETPAPAEAPLESEPSEPQNETISETAPTEPEIAEKSEDEEDTTEKVFDLSAFFDRLAECKAIEDPFTYPYPYPLTGVDARWKRGEKQYRYDPQFLFQFRDTVNYPVDDAWKEKLEGLGIVPNKKSGPGGPQRMNSSRFGSQAPGRMGGGMQRPGSFDGRQNSRSGSRRRGGSSAGNPRDRSLRNKNQSRRGHRDREEDAAPPKPAEDVKPLVPSANRWVPRSRQKTTEVKTAPDGTVLLDKEDVERKVKSALNKLTLEMFEPISEQMLDIAKQSRHEEDAATIKQVISLTFAKACDEPYWSSVYAQFCAKMVKEIPDDIKDVSILTKSGEPAIGGDLARRILLATCQSEYEKGWVDKLPTNEDGSPLEPEMMSDEYYAMAAAKRRGLGLVKFIGNLYILNMLNDQVILHCLRDQSKNVTDPSEDSLENLAQLIKTVGPRFEASERNKAALNMIFDNVQSILENCKLSSRIKFMLMDLQDLKKSNWKSLKQESGPKTIKEIHNEAELKKLEESKAQAEKRRNKGYDRGGYGGGDSRSNSTRGGASWGNKKESRAPTKDSRGFQSVPRSQSNRPTPDTSFSAAHASPRENSKRTDSMASNIFAALDGDNDDNESEGAGH